MNQWSDFKNISRGYKEIVVFTISKFDFKKFCFCLWFSHLFCHLRIELSKVWKQCCLPLWYNCVPSYEIVDRIDLILVIFCWYWTLVSCDKVWTVRNFFDQCQRQKTGLFLRNAGARLNILIVLIDTFLLQFSKCKLNQCNFKSFKYLYHFL